MWNEKEVSAQMREIIGALVGLVALMAYIVTRVILIILLLHLPMVALAFYFIVGHLIILETGQPCICVGALSVILFVIAYLAGVTFMLWDSSQTQVKIVVLAVLLYVLSISILSLA